MLTKFLESWSGKVTEKWQVGVFLPPLLFWSGGFCVYVWRYGWQHVVTSWAALSESVQILLGLMAVLVLLLTSALAEAFDLRILRLLEGYWPRPLSRVRRWALARQEAGYARENVRYQELSSRVEALNGEELAELTRIEGKLRRIPTDPELRMPTRVGNILRAAELRPGEKYGLNSMVCWPRLWLLLPDSATQQLVEARTSLDVPVRACFFALLFLVWAVWEKWVVPLSLLSVLLAWQRIVDAAEVYADIQESIFDDYRGLLYKALRWPLPANPQAELDAGQLISAYLWRGSDDTTPTFTTPHADPPH